MLWQYLKSPQEMVYAVTVPLSKLLVDTNPSSAVGWGVVLKIVLGSCSVATMAVDC